VKAVTKRATILRGIEDSAVVQKTGQEPLNDGGPLVLGLISKAVAI
jgi:hypothetical protein